MIMQDETVKPYRNPEAASHSVQMFMAFEYMRCVSLSLYKIISIAFVMILSDINILELKKD